MQDAGHLSIAREMLDRLAVAVFLQDAAHLRAFRLAGHRSIPSEFPFVCIVVALE